MTFFLRKRGLNSRPSDQISKQSNPLDHTLNKRLDLHYTLSVSSDRGYGEFVVAKVKWEQEGVKKKYPYYNVQIGYLKNFKKGLKDPQLILEADIKVKEFINKKFPIEIKNIDGEILKIKS